MRRRITTVAVVAVLVSAFGLAPSDAKPFDGGTGTVACGDGTVTYSPLKMFPPNHTLQNVTMSYEEASDDGDTLSLTVESITHNEEGLEKGSTAQHEPDWSGEGNTDDGIDTAPPDAANPATVVAQVNAERLTKPKDGRIYTITVSCGDSGDVILPGTEPTATLAVCIPHSRKRNCA